MTTQPEYQHSQAVRQRIIDQFYRRVYAYAPPAPRIICGHCSRSALGGADLKKYPGGFWRCELCRPARRHL